MNLFQVTFANLGGSGSYHTKEQPKKEKSESQFHSYLLDFLKLPIVHSDYGACGSCSHMASRVLTKYDQIKSRK